ncbi:branched-chain amino acid ABC transporter permease [Paraburkholderia sp. JHI869]|uniref:branched-chain amino acid ABC transporter permease n=1 Tax=Paraburkholderia sp. JHI869 TaxID=3112959 RepID=UPI00317DBF4B
MNSYVLKFGRRALLFKSLFVSLIVMLLILPFTVRPDSFVLHVLFSIFIYAVLGHAWNLLAGYCGLLSFGNQVYIGVGAFSMAIGSYYFHLPVWVCWPLSGLISLLFGWMLAMPRRGDRASVLRVTLTGLALWLGYEIAIAMHPEIDVFGGAYSRRVAAVLLIFLAALPLLRLQGAYFAIATWLIAESINSFASTWSVVGGGGGMQVRFGVGLPELYLTSLALLVIVTLAIRALLRSKYGLALEAVRDDEEAAMTVGVDNRVIKTGIFMLSSLITGLAAGLYYIDAIVTTPPDAFNLSWSAYLVFIVVAGGMGTLYGPIIGAVLFVAVEQLLSGAFGGGLLVLGIASILLMLFMPQGLLGVAHTLLRHKASNRIRELRRVDQRSGPV